MVQPLPAAIAFFAFGALFLGSVLLLLLNPRSQGVRWFVLFQAGNLVWLGGQGWAFAVDGWPSVGWIVPAAVHMLPALFLAFALVEGCQRPPRDAVLAVALGFALLPISLGTLGGGYAGWFIPAWHIGGWGIGTLLLMRSLTGRYQSGRSGSRASWRLETAVISLLLVIAPAVLAGVIVFGVPVFHYAMPLVVVWIQILVFVGVVHLRFYDIEVRAARTGELAAGAAEAERLALVGELSASLAHEIRNPLTGVRSLAQRLAEEEIDRARQRRYAGVILEEVGRVERLVSNLLELARRAPPQPRKEARTPLAPLFEDLLLLLGSRAEKAGVRIVVERTDSVAAAPREILAQVLLNLLLNAIQHSPRGGTVRLSAREDGGAMEVLVRDSGHGIPVAERERIWEPFHSTSGGTGLGLAVVRRLARDEAWEVGVEESPDGGAEFRVRIPGRTAAEPLSCLPIAPRETTDPMRTPTERRCESW
jgi:signal transduction histidine kinase